MINKIAKRPVVNGAAAFTILAVVIACYWAYVASQLPDAAYKVGEIFGSFLFPLCASIYLWRKFSEESKAAKLPKDEAS